MTSLETLRLTAESEADAISFQRRKKKKRKRGGSHWFDRIDCVMMLTWSNWATELRSNRYHYASRFAARVPVLFVQPDLGHGDSDGYAFEETELKNVSILHVSASYGQKQNAALNLALGERGFKAPLLWCYNPYFLDFYSGRFAPFKVYHATEDYFTEDVLFRQLNEIPMLLRRLFHATDLLVAVSEGVLANCVEKGGFRGHSIILENGCDFKLWAPRPEEIDNLERMTLSKIVFYQGGICRKLDFALLDAVLAAMPDWTFWFCGEVYDATQDWNLLRQRHANLKYLGKLSPELVRDLSYQASVGIIPFVQTDAIVAKSAPLKAFEYLSTGLPIVSIPIRSLERYDDFFSFCKSSAEFIRLIPRVGSTRYDRSAINKRVAVAATKDYDLSFGRLIAEIESKIKASYCRRRVLVLTHSKSVNELTDDRLQANMRQQLLTYSLLSRNDVRFAVIDEQLKAIVGFDAVAVIVAEINEPALSTLMARLADFGGYQILLDDGNHSESFRRLASEGHAHMLVTPSRASAKFGNHDNGPHCKTFDPERAGALTAVLDDIVSQEVHCSWHPVESKVDCAPLLLPGSNIENFRRLLATALSQRSPVIYRVLRSIWRFTKASYRIFVNRSHRSAFPDNTQDTLVPFSSDNFRVASGDFHEI